MITATSTELVDKALSLSVEERAFIAERLIASLGPPPLGTNGTTGDSLVNEIARRQSEVRDGTATLLSFDETINRMRQAVEDQRQS